MANSNRSIPPSFPQENTVHRVALYARVSTLNGQNPEMQLAELREYAQRRGWLMSKRYPH